MRIFYDKEMRIYILNGSNINEIISDTAIYHPRFCDLFRNC